MTLLEAVSACRANYANFSGRARRSEYWLANLAFFLAQMAWAILLTITGWEVFRFLIALFWIICLLPLLAVSVRRLHDIGRSGWWLLIKAIPLAGDIVILVFSCLDSVPFTNQYGPSPKASLYPPLQAAGPALPAPAEDSALPSDQVRQQAFFQTADRQRYDTGESASSSSKKVDTYVDRAKGQKPTKSSPAPKSSTPLSKLSRKPVTLIAAGTVVAIVILSIVMGTGLWRSTPSATVQPALVPASQPAAIPGPELSPSVQVTTQVAVPAAATVPPSIPPTSPEPTGSVIQAGDLGLTSPLRPVGCTGQFIVVYHSSVIPSAYAQDVQTNLESHPGSKYLVTLGSCAALNRMSEAGTLIYTVYGGPYDTLTQACVAASRFPDTSYVKVMDAATLPDQAVRPCP